MFTAEELSLIQAMCKSANPWFPERPMYPPWEGIYNKATQQLIEHDQYQCRHFDDGCHCLCPECMDMKS